MKKNLILLFTTVLFAACNGTGENSPGRPDSMQSGTGSDTGTSINQGTGERVVQDTAAYRDSGAVKRMDADSSHD